MSALDFEDTIMLGAESLRPVKRGDDLQIGSAWAAPSRKMSPSERLQRDRLERGAALGHAVALWTAVPIGLVVVVSLVAGWL